MPTSQNRSRVRITSFYAALALITYLIYVIIRPFIVPLCAAAALVVFFYPWHARLERRFRPGLAAFASTVLVTAMLIVPMMLVVRAFVHEAAAAVSSLQGAIAAGEVERVGRWWTWLQQHTPIAAGTTLSQMAEELGRRVGSFAAESAGDLLRNIGVLLFDLVVLIFAMFFIFRDARSIMALVRRVLPFEEEQREAVIRQAHELIRAGIVSSVAVAGAQGTACGLLFWAVGIGAPVFWGVVTLFMSLLPIGAWVVWLPAGIWLLVNGSTGKGIVLLAVGTSVVSMIDNVLRPALLSGRARMNGLLVLISLLGGISAFGLVGVIIGPVIVATMASLLSAYTSPVADRREELMEQPVVLSAPDGPPRGAAL
jgi:predicted PurR-regulated permease PerM